MRTTLNIDQNSLALALAVSPGKTKTQVVNEALQLYAQRQRIHQLIDYRGKLRWEGNLDELRGRQ